MKTIENDQLYLMFVKLRQNDQNLNELILILLYVCIPCSKKILLKLPLLLLVSTSTTGSDDLHNVDPNGLYPQHYVALHDYIYKSSPSATSSEEDDDSDIFINGMPSRFKGMSLIYNFYLHLVLML